jgi:hypothetical protein
MARALGQFFGGGVDPLSTAAAQGAQGKGTNNIQNLGAAAHMIVDSATHELYVADGYVSHRVIVFDATTGAYERHRGAYGKPPDDN